MRVDILLDAFGASWQQVRDAVLAAEEHDIDGVWFWDHLSGVVHRSPHVLECWTLLTAAASMTSRLTVGPLVLNYTNRPAGVLAQMASTLQLVSGGRLLLGLGAGTGPTSRYAQEQRLLGRPVPADPDRRAGLRRYVEDIRRCWSGRDGFIAPDPAPPIVVGAFGTKMAQLSAEVGDGVNVYADLPNAADLLGAAATAAQRPGFLRTVYAGADPEWLDPASERRRRFEPLAIDRLILVASAPFVPDIEAIAVARSRHQVDSA